MVRFYVTNAIESTNDIAIINAFESEWYVRQNSLQENLETLCWQNVALTEEQP